MNLDLRRALNARYVEEKEKIEKGISCCENYSLLEFGRDLVVSVRKSEECVFKFNVGFPFPLESYELGDVPVKKGFAVNVFLRGERVRGYQRSLLSDEFGAVYKVNCGEFKELVEKGLGRVKEFAYVDPYDFIGDGYIGFYFAEKFMKKFNVRRLKVFSKSWKHMECFYQSFSRNPEDIARNVGESCSLIMPDLIDDHFSFTMDVLRKLVGKNVNVVVPGRNLYLEFGEFGTKVYWCGMDDVLLRDSNIEDYMDGVLEPFLGREKKKVVIYFNPFGSCEGKFISSDFAEQVCKKLSFLGAEIVLVGGMKNREDHLAWVDGFLSKGVEVSLRYYENLSDLAREMVVEGCNLVVTADTSITHLANRLKIWNFTVYNSGVWDRTSFQSMASDSPLGFCRFCKWNLPVVLKSDGYERTAENLVRGAMYCLGFSSDVSWMREVYDLFWMVGGLESGKHKNLSESAVKISPEVKLGVRNLLFNKDCINVPFL